MNKTAPTLLSLLAVVGACDPEPLVQVAPPTYGDIVASNADDVDEDGDVEEDVVEEDVVEEDVVEEDVVEEDVVEEDPGEEPREQTVPFVDDGRAAVGRTMEVGAGRLFVWGDEHVYFDEYRPSVDAFWIQALAWLACVECEEPRVTVSLGRPSAAAEEAAAQLGLVVVQGRDADIVVGDEFGLSGETAVQVLERGGAVMVMAIGYGDSECAALNAATVGLPLGFDCDAEPWSAGALVEHPISDGLTPDAFPFVNGRVVVQRTTGSQIVALAP